jgi:hypothetical protein
VAISPVQVTAAMMDSTGSWAASFVSQTILELSDRTGQALSTAGADAERPAGENAVGRPVLMAIH